MRRWSDELAEDREFEIGGELFEWIYPHWEIGAKLFDDDMTPAEKNGDGEQQFSFVADTKLALDRIPLFLNPKNDSHKRFKALAARKTEAVPRYQFVQLYRWLVQVTGGLPTTPPSGSAPGGGENDAGSLEGSSSQEATQTA
jgi:hypothetical protein